MTRAELAHLIDHTLLRAEATDAEIARLCQEARQLGFYAVCVNPYWVPRAARELAGTSVKMCAVAGFPLGAHPIAAKAFEAGLAVESGAAEVDMVMNLGAFGGGDLAAVEDDVATVRRAIGTKVVLKVIVEAAILTREQKVQAARLVVEAGADFVKTSTGFHPAGGATVDDVRLLKSTIGRGAKVKASGGIHDLRAALAMLEAGADRLGTSASVVIVEELPAG